MPQAAKPSGFVLQKRLRNYAVVDQAALGQAIAAFEEDKRAVDRVAVAREVALKDAEAAKECCRLVEAELEIMRNEHAVEAHGRKAEQEKMKAQEDAVNGRDAELEQSVRAQAAERSRLEKLEKKVEAEKAQLEAKVKVLAEDRAAFKSLEEGVVDGIGPAVEGEARALSSSPLTRVFSHLHLRDPDADLGELLKPVEEGRCTAAAEVVKDQVEALLKKFLAINPAPPADGAASPATKLNDTTDGDAADGKALPDDGTQG
nr:uncharacterized abhydrolase domain-containing protein DDB_G0269086-like [Aegilops tauschii subsp. strangulata]